jgi:hypothetical protein
MTKIAISKNRDFLDRDFRNRDFIFDKNRVLKKFYNFHGPKTSLKNV